MNTRIASLFAPRALGAFFALALLALLASPAAAQLSGGMEGRTYHVVVDPAGVNVHVGTVWFGEGESIWQAEDKVDLADMSKGVRLEYQGITTIPSGLSTNYSSSVLTSSTTFYDVHVFERPSDDKDDLALVIELESSCSTDCYLDTLEFLMVDNFETDLESPGTVTQFDFDYQTSFAGLSGDTVEDHVAD